jgi:hypothetical protein
MKRYLILLLFSLPLHAAQVISTACINSNDKGDSK